MSEDGPAKAGIKFGNYEVIANAEGGPDLLGSGAYGKTYKALHSFLGTTVALKVIHDSFAFDAGVKKRFLADARAMARLKHPHIAQVVDCGEDEGTLYYAMEYCDGGDLERLVTTRGALSDETALLLMKQAAKALSYVHGQGFLHRDLKPSNLMLSMEGGSEEANLKVIDFGLVKALSHDNSVGMTQTGQFLGTLLFASPEQLREEDLDERTDVFSLGLTLWFLLEGGLPLKGKPAQVVAQRLSGQSYADLLPKESHPAVCTLLNQMLHPDRNERPRDMHAVLEGIAEVLSQLKSGTGQIHLEGRLPGRQIVRVPETNVPKRVGLVSSNQRLSSQFEVGEEDKEMQTDLGLRCRGKRVPQGDPVHLTVIRKALAADSLVVQQLDDLVSKASLTEGRFLIRPLALVQFVDQLVLAEEFVEGLTLLNVLRARRAISLSESSPILRQLAEACDLAKRGGLASLELVAHHVMFQFPRNSVAGMTSGGVERLISRPVSQWPPYLVRIAPAYTMAQRSGSSVVPSGRTMSMHAGATMLPNMDEDADSPSRFARLIYRILSGHPVPAAAMMSSKAYVSAPSISEEGNRLLAEVIGREVQISDCLSLLQQLWRVESAPECPLILPEEADKLTNLRAATPTEVPNPVPPPLYSSNTTQEVVVLDPFTSKEPCAPKPDPRPALPQPPVAKKETSRPATASPPSPQRNPTQRSPSSAPLQTPVPPSSTQPSSRPQPQPIAKAATQSPPPPVPVASRSATPVRPPEEPSRQIWVKPQTHTSEGSAKAGVPAQQIPSRPPSSTPEKSRPAASPKEAVNHGRSPHLPPPIEKRTYSGAFVMAGIGIAASIIGLGILVYSMVKPDPVQEAVKQFGKEPEKLIARLKQLNQIDSTIESKVSALENSAGAEKVFIALRSFFEEGGRTAKIPPLVEKYKAEGVREAWDASLKEATQKKDFLGQFDDHLHIATTWGDTKSLNWLRSEVPDQGDDQQAGKVADLISTQLEKASDSEKKEWVPDLLKFKSKAAQNAPRSPWQDFAVYARYGLETEPEALRLLENATVSDFPDSPPDLVQAVEKANPAKAFDLHRSFLSKQPGRADSTAFLFSRLPLSPPPNPQQADALLTALTPALDLDPSQKEKRARDIVNLMLIADPALNGEKWKKLWDFYTSTGLSAQAEKLLAEKAQAGDSDAMKLQESMVNTQPPDKQWAYFLPRALGGNTSALDWLVGRPVEELLQQSAGREIELLLSKRLESPPADEAKRVELATKVGKLKDAHLAANKQSAWDLFQFYEKQKLPMQAKDALDRAKKALIPEALLKSARDQQTAGNTSAAVADYLACWNQPTAKKSEALEGLLSTVSELKDEKLGTEALAALKSVFESQLREGASQIKARTVGALASLIKLDGSKSEEQRRMALKTLYDSNEMKAEAAEISREMWKSDFRRSQGVFASNRDAAVKTLHELASSAAANAEDRQEVISWLQANVTAEFFSDGTDFKVKDPVDRSIALMVGKKDWKKGAPITVANEKGEKRYFALPAELPLLVASADGSKKPTSKTKPGSIVSPYSGDRVTISQELWYPGAIIDDEGGNSYKLPQDIELLEAKATSAGEVFSPFEMTGDSKITVTEYASWKPAARLKDAQGREFMLPADELPTLEKAITAEEMNPNGFLITSPYTKKTFAISLEQWRSAKDVEDPELKSLGVKALIKLPAKDRPLFVAKLGSKAPEVIDPTTSKTFLVKWSQWKPGAKVTKAEEIQSTAGTGRKKRTTTTFNEVALFSLPEDLGALADPKMEGSDPNRVQHTIKSPYGGHSIEVNRESWRPGAIIKDSDLPHLSVVMPGNLGEWFEMETGTAIDGSYSKVRSPYGGKPTVSVGKSNWESGKAKDGDLPFKMPRIADPNLKAEVISEFKYLAKNPYTGETESWEGNWRDGASRTWAANLTYHLPTPVPKFEVKTASYVGNRTIRSPYGEGTKTVTWEQLSSGGTTSDSSGRPMRIPSIPDPRLGVTLSSNNASFTNPYSGSPDTWKSSFKKGAEQKWKSFTIVATDVVESINGVTKKQQRGIIVPGPRILLSWQQSEGVWRSQRGAVVVNDALTENLETWTKALKWGGLIPKNFKLVHLGGGQIQCSP